MPEWETSCSGPRSDGKHCACWYDGEQCCYCGDNSPSTPTEKLGE